MPSTTLSGGVVDLVVVLVSREHGGLHDEP